MEVTRVKAESRRRTSSGLFVLRDLDDPGSNPNDPQ